MEAPGNRLLRELNVKTLKLPDAQQNENIQFTIGFEAKKKKTHAELPSTLILTLY